MKPSASATGNLVADQREKSPIRRTAILVLRHARAKRSGQERTPSQPLPRRSVAVGQRAAWSAARAEGRSHCARALLRGVASPTVGALPNRAHGGRKHRVVLNTQVGWAALAFRGRQLR